MGYGIPMMSKEGRIYVQKKDLYVSPGTRPKWVLAWWRECCDVPTVRICQLGAGGGGG